MSVDAGDFSPPLLRIQARAPVPLAGWTLRLVVGLLSCLLVWATFGALDIVAVAEGKLVPSGYLKIVQPAEQGIVRAILVREGQHVREGEVLIRMDSALTQADARAMTADYHHKRLALRRIDAQLADAPLVRGNEDPQALFDQVAAQYAANVRAYENALAQEHSLLEKTRHELRAARETKSKLEQVLPHYVDQEKAFEKLSQDGFAGRIMYTDKRRERIEKEQDLRTQEYVIRASQALITQSEKKITQIGADYRRALQTERVEVAAQLERAREELAKQQHRQELLELRAPQAGTVKDLATHTPGTVVSPGTILMTIVPLGDKLRAEVWVSNDDAGFVHPGQPVKLKLAAFPFQKYGVLEGKVVQVSADATEAPSPNTRSGALAGRDRPAGPLSFRTLIDLDQDHLPIEGRRHALVPGMQVAAEVHLGSRTVLEYVLSPMRKAFHEAGRER